MSGRRHFMVLATGTGHPKLVAWERLFHQPEIRMDAEEQYEALLRLADDFEEQGIISREERRALIEKATA